MKLFLRFLNVVILARKIQYLRENKMQEKLTLTGMGILAKMCKGISVNVVTWKCPHVDGFFDKKQLGGEIF